MSKTNTSTKEKSLLAREFYEYLAQGWTDMVIGVLGDLNDEFAGDRAQLLRHLVKHRLAPPGAAPIIRAMANIALGGPRTFDIGMAMDIHIRRFKSLTISRGYTKLWSRVRPGQGA